jgi:hypothetical protein
MEPYRLLRCVYVYTYLLASSVCESIRRNTREIHTFTTLFSLSKLPQAAALSNSEATTNPTPILGDETSFDYVVHALMAIYLFVVWFVGPRTKAYALAIMLAMAVLWPVLVSDAFATGICRTYVKLFWP